MDVLRDFHHAAGQVSFLIPAVLGVGVEDHFLLPANHLLPDLIATVCVGVGLAFLLTAHQLGLVTGLGVGVALGFLLATDQVPIRVVAAGVLGAGQLPLRLIALFRVDMVRLCVCADQRFPNGVTLLRVDMPRMGVTLAFLLAAHQLDFVAGLGVGVALGFLPAADQGLCLLVAGLRVSVGLSLLQGTNQRTALPIARAVVGVGYKVCIAADKLALLVVAAIRMSVQVVQLAN